MAGYHSFPGCLQRAAAEATNLAIFQLAKAARTLLITCFADKNFVHKNLFPTKFVEHTNLCRLRNCVYDAGVFVTKSPPMPGKLPQEVPVVLLGLSWLRSTYQ